jgi:hypothetical protein
MLIQEKANLRQKEESYEELRNSGLNAKVDDTVKSGKKSKASTIRKMSNQEAGRRTYRTIDAMRQKSGAHQKLDRLEIPTSWPAPHSTLASTQNLEDPSSCTKWMTITDPSAIEYYLMLRNRLHFGQAHGTPFTTSLLTDNLDWAASTPQADDILAGTYESQVDIPQVQTVLKACKAAAELDNIPAELTMEDFQGKISTWREGTSTSPSGRHPGRYKALFAHISYCRETNEFQYSEFLRKQQSIAALVLSVMNDCIRNDYVLERWKTIANIQNTIFHTSLNGTCSTSTMTLSVVTTALFWLSRHS